MNAFLAPIERCREVAGLAPHEMVLGVSPNEAHARMLDSYRRARHSQAMARARIVADIRAAVSCGATREAADLLVVLRWLLATGAADSPRLSAPSCSRRQGRDNRRRTSRAASASVGGDWRPATQRRPR